LTGDTGAGLTTAEDTSDTSNQEEIVVSKDDSASRKDTGADVKAQIGAMLSNEGCPVTVEIISVRHGVCLINGCIFF